MKGYNIRASLALLIGLSLVGCATDQAMQQPQPQTREVKKEPVGEEPRRALAGVWVYEENGIAVPLVLDEQGNGAYPWQEGSLVTISLSDGVWRGTWHQAKNDREGEFEILLTEDRSGGAGRWWYTRIGDDRKPGNPGGTFSLTRGSDEDLDFEPDPFD